MQQRQLFPQSRMENFYSDARPMDTLLCDVVFDGNKIRIEYHDRDSLTGRMMLHVYAGQYIDSAGHYTLTQVDSGHPNTAAGDGRATLHRTPGSLFLEGSWIEYGYRGMWRIVLAKVKDN